MEWSKLEGTRLWAPPEWRKNITLLKEKALDGQTDVQFEKAFWMFKTTSSTFYIIHAVFH